MEPKKVALVTGASKGIGRACCYELSKRGYHIALHYRSNEEEAQALASELVDSSVYCFDLSKEGACEALIKSIKQDHNRLDVLVNNAGIAVNKLLAFSKPSDFESIINTNLRSVFLLSKGASRLMIKQRNGSIINISSVVGFMGNGGQSLYTATKGAITSFTKSLALELGSAGIRCNCVAPGYISTNMTEEISQDIKEKIFDQIPLKRFGSTDEVAKSVGFLASSDASYITGTTIHVNGGLYRA